MGCESGHQLVTAHVQKEGPRCQESWVLELSQQDLVTGRNRGWLQGRVGGCSGAGRTEPRRLLLERKHPGSLPGDSRSWGSWRSGRTKLEIPGSSRVVAELDTQHLGSMILQQRGRDC